MNDKIKEINNKWKNTIEEKLKERDALNNKAVEELLNKISNDTADMMQSQLIKYIDNIKKKLENQLLNDNCNNQDKNKISQVLNNINCIKEDIRKNFDESRKNFSEMIEISKLNENE